MDLLWPGFLILLGLIPLLIVAYIVVLRRRRRVAIRYSSLSLVRSALPRMSRVRRHLPFALLMIALGSLVIAAGRPISIVSVPTDQTTIILSIDVSRSMCSTDIEPNRLQAAEDAAITFIRGQKSSTQIGVVAFSGFAELVHPPTRDGASLESAIQSLLTGRRTAIGSGILKAIDTIAEIDNTVAPSVPSPDDQSFGQFPNEAPSQSPSQSSGVKPVPVPKGAYAPDIIVLLTDGASNAGPLPLEAAQQAADRGVRVYTIGFGTANGGEFANCGQFQGREPFGGGGGQQFGGGGGGGFGGGGQFRRGIDEDTLKQIAALTGGEYYSAESAGELNAVFQNLPTYLIVKHEVVEVSVAFAAIGALMVTLAFILSLLWNPLP